MVANVKSLYMKKSDRENLLTTYIQGEYESLVSASIKMILKISQWLIRLYLLYAKTKICEIWLICFRLMVVHFPAKLSRETTRDIHIPKSISENF